MSVYNQHYRPRRLNNNRLALVDWLSTETFDVEISLTFKRRLTLDEAENRLAYFWRTVDESLFKRSERRQGQGCVRACFVETGISGEHVHYHIAAKLPKSLSFQMFKTKLEIFWNNTNDAGLAEFEPIRNNDAFLRYITKC